MDEENCKRKYVTEVQRENSRKFNYYTEWISDEKLLKPSQVWKNDQHGKVACLQQLSIGISLAQFRWVRWRATSSGWRSTSKKITWKTEWSSGTRTEKFRFFTRCIFEESVSWYRQNAWSRRFRNYLKTARNQRKPSTWKSFAFSVAIQRYIIYPIPIKFVEITAKIHFLHFQNWLKTVKNWEKQYITKSFAFVHGFQRHIICCVRTHG